MSPSKDVVVFLDRDGTIIVDKHYLHSPEQVELEAHAAEGLAQMAQLGAELVVISNQSGVGRGYFGTEAVEAANARLAELLAPHGVTIDTWFFCPHVPEDNCTCRKPHIGMVEAWREKTSRKGEVAFVVGDKMSDVEVALAIGGTGILIDPQARDTGHAADVDYWIARDLREAASQIRSLVVV